VDRPRKTGPGRGSRGPRHQPSPAIPRPPRGYPGLHGPRTPPRRAPLLQHVHRVRRADRPPEAAGPM